MITQKELKTILSYDKATGNFRWLITPNRRINIGVIAGSLNDGRVIIIINKIKYKAHRLAWLFEYGYFPESGIDHIDRDPSNNAIKNLREVSQSCNLRNSGNSTRNSSGVKGVSWSPKEREWRVRILEAFVGNFKAFDEAVLYRLAAEQCLNWAGCNSTSPAFLYVREVLKIPII